MKQVAYIRFDGEEYPYYIMKKILILFYLLCPLLIFAQEDDDAFKIREIYDISLTQGDAYETLEHLCTKVGGRLSGSSGAAAAVDYGKAKFETMGFDSVWLQPCMVPHWERGDKEVVKIVASQTLGTQAFNGIALGGSGRSGKLGVAGEVIEVQGIEELKALGAAKVRGKIVFYNRPMDPLQVSTFAAYGGAVDQRVYGPEAAMELGAVATLVRSMTTKLDDVPHSGVTYFEDRSKAIPAVAISTKDAELLSTLLEKEPVRVYVKTDCQWMPDKLSYNVVGEIKGSTFPDEIIVVGGHLDSWDVNQGAHDDGAGCTQALDVINTFKKLKIKPQRTLRCVWFMNEENGQEGAKAYANWSNDKGEKHIAAIESDRGGFTPRGFTTEADEAVYKTHIKKAKKWDKLLSPYGIVIKPSGGSGADVTRLKPQMGLLFGLQPDSQRYFDYHHAPNDNFEAVNKRELELGAAAMSSLVYLLDKYGM